MKMPFDLLARASSLVLHSGLRQRGYVAAGKLANLAQGMIPTSSSGNLLEPMEMIMARQQPQHQTMAQNMLRPVLQMSRGGAAAAALDLSRESHNIAMLASYGVVTALMMNSALRLYSGTKFKSNPNNKSAWVPPFLFSLSSGLCLLSGLFSTVIFQMMAIYCKASLGMGGVSDEGYKAFWEATHKYRTWGFRSFLTSCVSFMGTFLLSYYSKCVQSEADDKHHFARPLFLGAVFLTLLGAYHVNEVVNLASTLIFTHR